MDWTQDFGKEIRSVLQKNQDLNAHIDKTGAHLCVQDLPKTGLTNVLTVFFSVIAGLLGRCLQCLINRS